MATMTGGAPRPVSYRDNPMWSRVQDLIYAGRLSLSHGILHVNPGYNPEWREVMLQHSPMVSHPDTIEKVIEMAGRHVVAVLVGNGYWPWLLGERGLNVNCFDDRKMWPRSRWGGIDVQRLDQNATHIRPHDRDTLLLVKPEKAARAALVLREFQGNDVVYLGPLPKPGLLAEALGKWRVREEYIPTFYRMEPFRVIHFQRTPEWICNSETQLMRSVPTS